MSSLEDILRRTKESDKPDEILRNNLETVKDSEEALGLMYAMRTSVTRKLTNKPTSYFSEPTTTLSEGYFSDFVVGTVRPVMYERPNGRIHRGPTEHSYATSIAYQATQQATETSGLSEEQKRVWKEALYLFEEQNKPYLHRNE